jgi:hypothetical protein
MEHAEAVGRARGGRGRRTRLGSTTTTKVQIRGGDIQAGGGALLTWRSIQAAGGGFPPPPPPSTPPAASQLEVARRGGCSPGRRHPGRRLTRCPILLREARWRRGLIHPWLVRRRRRPLADRAGSPDGELGAPTGARRSLSFPGLLLPLAPPPRGRAQPTTAREALHRCRRAPLRDGIVLHTGVF